MEEKIRQYFMSTLKKWISPWTVLRKTSFFILFLIFACSSVSDKKLVDLQLTEKDDNQDIAVKIENDNELSLNWSKTIQCNMVVILYDSRIIEFDLDNSKNSIVLKIENANILGGDIPKNLFTPGKEFSLILGQKEMINGGENLDAKIVVGVKISR